MSLGYMIAAVEIGMSAQLSTGERMVLLMLANHARCDTGRCWPSQRLIMDETGLSERAVRKAVGRFIELGLIGRIGKVRGNGSTCTPTYEMLFDPSETRHDVPTSGAGTRHMAPSNPAHGAPLEPVREPLSSSSLRSEEHETTRARERHPVPGEGASAAPRGSRLPQGWLPEAADIEWAVDLFAEHLDWIAARRAVEDELEKFRDYWCAVPGAKGRKLDWRATWRNWIRRASEDRAGRRGFNGKRYRNPALAAADYFRALDGE